jgi:hypothetical protein
MLTALDEIYPSNYSNIYEETSPIEQYFTFLVGNPSYSTQYYSPPTTEFETQHSSAQNFSAPHDTTYVPSPQQQAPPPHHVSLAPQQSLYGNMLQSFSTS